MLRYKTETRPGLVGLYIRPGNGADQFLSPRNPHGVSHKGRDSRPIYILNHVTQAWSVTHWVSKNHFLHSTFTSSFCFQMEQQTT